MVLVVSFSSDTAGKLSERNANECITSLQINPVDFSEAWSESSISSNEQNYSATYYNVTSALTMALLVDNMIAMINGTFSAIANTRS